MNIRKLKMREFFSDGLKQKVEAFNTQVENLKAQEAEIQNLDQLPIDSPDLFNLLLETEKKAINHCQSIIKMGNQANEIFQQSSEEWQDKWQTKNDNFNSWQEKKKRELIDTGFRENEALNNMESLPEFQEKHNSKMAFRNFKPQETDLRPIKLEADRKKQALLNLVTNRIQAMSGLFE